MLLVSCSDESLSPISSSILFGLSGRVSENTEAERERESLAMANMRLNLQRNEIEDSHSSV